MVALFSAAPLFRADLSAHRRFCYLHKKFSVLDKFLFFEIEINFIKKDEAFYRIVNFRLSDEHDRQKKYRSGKDELYWRREQL
jgi:hypothetical protein